MKTPVSPRTVALLVFGMMAPLYAQNPTGAAFRSTCSQEDATTGAPARFGSELLPGSLVVPVLNRAQSEVSADAPVFASQNSLSLDEKQDSSQAVDAVLESTVLKDSSIVHKVKVSTRGVIYQVNSNSLGDGLERMSALYRESGKSESAPDCQAIFLSVEQRVRLDSSKVLEIVESEVSANPGCACEIVKAAIKASEANATEVVAIVETAIHASPESMRIVSQCAIAASPDSVTGVQALLAKLDPNSGETGYSSKGSKSAKGAKVASIVSEPPADPLDRPYIPPLPPINPPPRVTEVDPCPWNDYKH